MQYKDRIRKEEKECSRAVSNPEFRDFEVAHPPDQRYVRNQMLFLDPNVERSALSDPRGSDSTQH